MSEEKTASHDRTPERITEHRSEAGQKSYRPPEYYLPATPQRPAPNPQAPQQPASPPPPT